MKPLALSSSISVAGISKLPADVISLILTFLPIKESVRTSILSKQWRHLWRSVPQLVFDEHFAAIHDEHFSAIHVYQALLVHEGPINKFELAIPGMKCCPQFDQLINSLSAKSVKELFLRIDSYALGPLKLDIVALFDSLPALEQLNLGVEFLLGYVPYHLPASLHNLKVLEIPRILLGRLNEARVLACLIMSSPNLLKLTIRDNEYDGRYRISESPGGLQRLLEQEEHIRVCCLQRLEEFTIGNSRGTQVELDLVRFVLATAPVLKRVFINPKKGLSSEIVTKFLVEVTQYERISRYARVNYALVKLDEA
ncbi:F-box/FBD/LRR-repeat protein At1g13570 [Linum perenne]